MHIHIGGGIIILMVLGVIVLLFAIKYLFFSNKSTALVSAPVPPESYNYTNYAGHVGGSGGGYGLAGAAYAPPYVPASNSGIGAGAGFVGGLAAGVLLDEVLTSRSHRSDTVIVEEGGSNYVPDVPEIPSGRSADDGRGGFWSLDVNTGGGNDDTGGAGSGSGGGGGDDDN